MKASIDVNIDIDEIKTKVSKAVQKNAVENAIPLIDEKIEDIVTEHIQSNSSLINKMVRESFERIISAHVMASIDEIFRMGSKRRTERLKGYFDVANGDYGLMNEQEAFRNGLELGLFSSENAFTAERWKDLEDVIIERVAARVAHEVLNNKRRYERLAEELTKRE